MKRTYQIGTAVIFTLGLLAFQNCGQSIRSAQSASSPQGKLSASDIEARYQDIRDAATNQNSCASDSDCEAIGVGGHNCGLPSEFVVTSKNADLVTIDRMNAELKSAEVQFMAANDLVAQCGGKDAPSVACVSNRCIAQ
jgi:hypothetical protein